MKVLLIGGPRTLEAIEVKELIPHIRLPIQKNPFSTDSLEYEQAIYCLDYVHLGDQRRPVYRYWTPVDEPNCSIQELTDFMCGLYDGYVAKAGAK